MCGCAVLVGTGMPDWTTEEILAVHVRMHKAEGELFRNVLVDGVRACGIELTTLPDRSALDAAAGRLGVTRAQLDAQVAALGKVVGPPWGKREKEAAAAALVVLTYAGGDEHDEGIRRLCWPTSCIFVRYFIARIAIVPRTGDLSPSAWRDTEAALAALRCHLLIDRRGGRDDVILGSCQAVLQCARPSTRRGDGRARGRRRSL